MGTLSQPFDSARASIFLAVTIFLAIEVEMHNGRRGRSQRAKMREEDLEAIRARKRRQEVAGALQLPRPLRSTGPEQRDEEEADLGRSKEGERTSETAIPHLALTRRSPSLITVRGPVAKAAAEGERARR